MAFNNSDWAAVYLNLRKYWRRWEMIVRVTESTGATVRAFVEMYKAVAQLVLLYRSESLVVNG